MSLELTRGTGFTQLPGNCSGLTSLFPTRLVANHSWTPRYRKQQHLKAMSSNQSAQTLFKFGVVSDVQYADIADGRSFHGVARYYRNALPCLRRAVQGWLGAGADFGIHFGDILDGFQPKDKSEEALTAVLDCFEPLQKPVLHLIGNHCLHNLSRDRLHQRLSIPPAADGASYYCYSPHPAWRFVFLDAYDISLLGWPQGHPRHQQAEDILNQRNPNQEKNSPDGLVGVARRFVKFGGGVSDQQLQWLQQQLQEAAAAGQCVILCSHLPLYPGTCPPACLLWNYEEVLQLLQLQPGVVVATIAGHTHQNGYLVDDAHIHHLVLPAIVETPPGRDCYGWVEVQHDGLVLRGVDTCMTCHVKMSPAAMQQQQRHFVQQQEKQQPQPEEEQHQEQDQQQAEKLLDKLSITGNGHSGSSSDIVVELVDVADAEAAGKIGTQAALASVAAAASGGGAAAQG